MLCKIADGSLSHFAVFLFQRSSRRVLARGARIPLLGEARRGLKGLEIVHPEYRLIDSKAGSCRGASHPDLSPDEG